MDIVLGLIENAGEFPELAELQNQANKRLKDAVKIHGSVGGLSDGSRQRVVAQNPDALPMRVSEWRKRKTS